MNTPWPRSREVEKPKRPQVSVASLPEGDRAAAMHKVETASEQFPSVELPSGSRLHICAMDGEWEIWLNTECGDFDGVCFASGLSRQEAVTAAVKVLEEALEVLQGPPA